MDINFDDFYQKVYIDNIEIMEKLYMIKKVLNTTDCDEAISCIKSNDVCTVRFNVLDSRPIVKYDYQYKQKISFYYSGSDISLIKNNDRNLDILITLNKLDSKKVSRLSFVIHQINKLYNLELNDWRND